MGAWAKIRDLRPWALSFSVNGRATLAISFFPVMTDLMPPPLPMLSGISTVIPGRFFV